MIIDIPGQFRKLCKYHYCLDMTREQMLEIAQSQVDGCRHRGTTGHWAYEGLSHHQALIELRDALVDECAFGEKVAA